MKVGSSPVTRTKEHTLGTHLAELDLPSRHHTATTQLQLSDWQVHMQLQQVCRFPLTEPGEAVKNQRGHTTSGFHKPIENELMFHLQYSFIQKLNAKDVFLYFLKKRWPVLYVRADKTNYITYNVHHFSAHSDVVTRPFSSTEPPR